MNFIRGGVSNGHTKKCSHCGLDKDLSAFNQCRSETDGRERQCKVCKSERWHRNRDKYMAHHQEWKSRQPTPEKVWRERIRAEMIAAYGGVCACCGEVESEFLTLDHIGGMTDANHPWPKKRKGTGIYGKLKKLGWPKDGYRLLCMNCNWAIRFGKVCPHQRNLRAVG